MCIPQQSWTSVVWVDVIRSNQCEHASRHERAVTSHLTQLPPRMHRPDYLRKASPSSGRRQEGAAREQRTCLMVTAGLLPAAWGSVCSIGTTRSAPTGSGAPARTGEMIMAGCNAVEFYLLSVMVLERRGSS